VSSPAAAGRTRGWRSHATSAAILAAALVVTVLGWRLFWFLTDDAFIAFRYASNARLGHGLVWNPPPFRPVEGYTSLLWVLVLRAVWTLLGVEPPDSANALALGFACATVVLGGLLVAWMRLPEPLARHRSVLLALALLGTVSNRTFLAWTSSGLETALFNFCLTAWVFSMWRLTEVGGAAFAWASSTAAALAALARPDGVLAVLATALVLGLGRVKLVGIQTPLRCALPLLAAPLHFLWRRATYGEWLPNTLYAKTADPWPESGLRYLLSFALEYALWIWLAVVLVALVPATRTQLRSALASARRRAPLVLVVAALLGHLAYYTLVVGGDHFEYRIYSHTVPLLFASFVFALGRLRLRPRAATALLAAFVLASWPLPWAHYLETRHVATRAESYQLFRPIAGRFPPPLRGYVGRFDSLQAWLIAHLVCIRHQEHKVFLRHQLETHPSREQGSRIGLDRLSLYGTKTVGVPGWVLPRVAILDYLGLNDHVVARTRPLHRQGDIRLMAHDRLPPPGYVECLHPDIAAIDASGVLRDESAPALTEERVRSCEHSFWR
jgi:arabinofuranosyltransferase